MKKKLFKLVAHTVLLSLGYQLVFPVCAYALTTGPSQPEVQSFEPVGTTEMVDMFSGDFNYNIPLLDVEGYPVNIFYHSGVGMEQEASWVGLGWNINPGEINRTVRGLPDDFNGETIEKFTKIKEERDVRIGIGANMVGEIFGRKLQLNDNIKISLGLGFYVNHNNYRGLSAGITPSVGIKTPFVSTGISLGIGSQSGADIDFNASAYASKPYKEGSTGGTIAAGTGFNSRTGLKAISLSVTPGTSTATSKQDKSKPLSSAGTDLGIAIPIGLQNYVPVITNPVYQSAYALQLKAGVELLGSFASVYVDAMVSNISYDPEGSRQAYGYLYSENASRESILDFSREKDGTYNETMKNLPMGANTYDIYSVNGQGTGGMFRPFRNDIGTIYDPYVSPEPASENYNGMLELGATNLFEAGGDLTTVKTRNESGPWTMLKYGGANQGTLYEKVFFKQGGDIAYNQQQEASQLFNAAPQYVASDMKTLVSANYDGSAVLPAFYNQSRIFWDNTTIDRSSRATHISFQTANEAMLVPDTDQPKKIVSYEDGTANHFYDPKLVSYNRTTGSAGKWSGNNYNMKPHHISEFTQTLQDGRRYVYGIPAMNNVTREVTFAVDEKRANLNNGYVGFYRGTDDHAKNRQGRDQFYSSTTTPSYAHSYLLTNVLSNDYVDVLGDGATDDDLGSFVKFNYTLKDNDYRWRTPYHKDSAQYNPGFWSDNQDGKGNYIAGSRQQWYIRSVESKNYIAEFYTSKRKDGRGIQDSILQSNSKLNRFSDINFAVKKADTSYSYQLDSIVLYNKHDRYINKNNAVPVKTVVLQYDYSLCPNTPNSVAVGNGKLTLKKLFIKYGTSQKNLLSPYVFNYNASNKAYDFAAKDRWGNYKPVVAGTYNYEFPYTDQPADADVPAQNDYLAAWNLTDIKLPSGGKLHVDYESDDYSFVQDKRAMQLMQIAGVGSSPAYEKKNALYHDLDNINDYVYFKRRKDKERPGVSMRDNYLENQDMLYYSFKLDIIGQGKAEQVKGYAHFNDVGICSNNTDYGYVKLQRDDVKKLKLHPATVYGINMARCYLPHLFYPGYEESSDAGKVLKGLFGAGAEMVNTLLLQNPFRRFINQQKAKYVDLAHSSIRLQTPCLTKKGGGIRVRQLSLSDNWSSMSGNPDASYGKKYDYTISDKQYGTISSGVASYEPMIGGDENPFRRPVPYAAEQGRMLPGADFFQEEPFGESFFPGASVGYSSVKVSSIHQAYGRSAQAVDEYLFYTAKDFPVKIDYTQIGGNKDGESRSLMNYYKEAEVMQGYSLVLNDMHGKPKAVNNYTLHNNGTQTALKRVTGVAYHYQTDANDKNLNNTVTALNRKRGTPNTYELKQLTLGQDIDFSIDSRQRKTSTNMNKTELNLNAFVVFGFPIFPYTVFHSERYKSVNFSSLVTTKIIQQYGILKSIEQFDHDAVTTTENLVYDGETGGVLLSRTSNQFNDFSYSRKDPAYLAYEGMRPTYTNSGYEEISDSLVINADRDGYLYTDNLDRFSAGDELLIDLSTGPKSMGMLADGASPYMKLWVLGKGANNSTATNSDVSSPEDPAMPVVTDSGAVVFWKWPDSTRYNPPSVPCAAIPGRVDISLIDGTGSYLILGGSGSVTNSYRDIAPPACGAVNCLTFKLPVGNYQYQASNVSGSYVKAATSFTITGGTCTNIGLHQCGSLASFASMALTLSEDNRCALKVVPRYKDKFAPGTTSPNISNWPNSPTTFKKMRVRVLRSGRRNNLDKTVQQTVFSNPGSGGDALLGSISGYFSKTSSVLSVVANTFTDTATIAHPFDNTLMIPGANGYAKFNAFVLGLRGNYRPSATYAPMANRSYAAGHERFDGTFGLSQPFWLFTNSYNDGTCDTKTDILRLNSLVGTLFWKRASLVTRYDAFGNALEEQDAIGNYTGAQYGYNKSLPTAVATNARSQQFMFDGFEEYNMLVPQTISLLYKKNDLYSFFGKLFGDILPDVITAGYTSEAPPPAGTAAFSRQGQFYNLHNLLPSGSLSCTKEASHTGRFSMKSADAADIKFEARPLNKDVAPFSFAFGKKYIINFWAKSTTAGIPVTAGMFKTRIVSGLYADMKITTSSIDGWYQLEGSIDLSRVSTPVNVLLNVPANVYIDDIRILPVDANMKSFVYDPMTFRLMAQLDENHFATFYEYDQEGLLIRTKKETSRGIMTISESRRSNTKKNL